MRQRANRPARRADDDPAEAARDRLGEAARIVGVDEAGRGPLAGPVVAAAVWLPWDSPLAARMGDSKALSKAARERLFEEILTAAGDGSADIGIGAASVREIDALNILRANDLAMRRAIQRLGARPDLALIDGSWRPPGLGCPAETAVKGDARCARIGAASILAKVTRDRIMARLAARHGAYGWGTNAGYPTKAHREAIAAHGPSAHHRRSFRLAAG